MAGLLHAVLQAGGRLQGTGEVLVTLYELVEAVLGLFIAYVPQLAL